jgi:cell division transport system ATP-binding protein
MIVFSEVTKSFGDSKTAINKFSYEINEGDFVVITGPSGAGKTTLMKLLIKEYEPSEGKIVFDGQEIGLLKDSDIPDLRRKIAVVFQDYKLISDMNVWENIALPMYIAGKSQNEIETRVTDLLNLVELADKALYFPRQLSGGEAQRIGIARALATSPKIIFADEPTGNLDAAAALRITRLLKKINELGTTLLFATHNDMVLKELAAKKIIELKKEMEEIKEEEKIEDKVEEKVETSQKDETNKEKIDEEEMKAEEKIHKAEEIAFKEKEKKSKKIKFPKIKKKQKKLEISQEIKDQETEKQETKNSDQQDKEEKKEEKNKNQSEDKKENKKAKKKKNKEDKK